MSKGTWLIGAVLAAVSVCAGAAAPPYKQREAVATTAGTATPPYALREAVVVVSGLKTAVAEFAGSFGAWPLPGDPAVVYTPATGYATQWIERLDLKAGGLIEVKLKAAVGGGRLQLRPQGSDPLQAITWLCESPDIADVAQVAGCTYTGAPTVETEVGLAVGPVAIALAEYYANHGVWPAPASPDIIGPPLSYAGPWVARMDLGANGLVIVALKPAAGGGTVKYTKFLNPAGMVYTVCVSANNANIAALLPGCSFTP